MIPLDQFQMFAKHAGMPLEVVKRPLVKGLKMPRSYTPRLGTGKPPGGTPANPFRPNWKKLGGLAAGLLGAGVVGTGAATAALTAKALRDPVPPKKSSGGAQLLRNVAFGQYAPSG